MNRTYANGCNSRFSARTISEKPYELVPPPEAFGSDQIFLCGIPLRKMEVLAVVKNVKGAVLRRSYEIKA